MRFNLAILLVLGLSASKVLAHYHMLIPAKHSIKANESVLIRFQFGHPFEHEMFDTAMPAKATIWTPDGKALDALPLLKKIEIPGEGKKTVKAFEFSFQPSRRGDFTILFETATLWVADEKHFLKDTARVVVHVETQNGWDANHSGENEFAILPMTRPYGLLAGSIFQTEVTPKGSHLLEVERYNEVAPKNLPPDEFITRSQKTDRHGIATTNLPEAGWWAITAIRRYPKESKQQMLERDGKLFPVIERATLWVFVNDPPTLKAAE